MGLAVVVNPNNTEGEHTLGLYHTAQQISLLILGMSVDDRGDGRQNFLYSLDEFGLIAVLSSDILNGAQNICIHNNQSPFLY
jgi:hypothetical protein